MPEPVVGAVVRTGGAVATTTGREVCVIVFERRSRWRTDPRGTPKPAEPGLMVRRRGAPDGGFTVRPCPTMTVNRPRTGGLGTGKRFGGFTIGGIAYQLFQEPGCHIQPQLCAKAQLPYRYGIQPHGYADTNI